MSRRNLIVLAVSLAALGALIFFVPPAQAPDGSYPYEIADTPEERERGLSGREPLSKEEGLLFVFPQDSTPGFWMKDMRFAIDIIWVAHDGTIVGIEPAVAPETYPTIFYPPAPVRYVLEVAAGVAEDHGWGIGTQIPLP